MFNCHNCSFFRRADLNVNNVVTGLQPVLLYLSDVLLMDTVFLHSQRRWFSHDQGL